MWDLRQPAAPRVRFTADAGSIAFSRDGRMLAVAAVEDPTEVRDPRSGKLIARLRTPDDGRSVAFSPDGRLVATGHFDGTAQLWSTDDWRPVGGPLIGHQGKRVLWLAFAAGGSMLVTTDAEGTAALFDVSTGNPVGVPLPVEPDSYVAGALSPDGLSLFAVATGHAGIRWNISPEAWKRQACVVAGREMTAREWDDALPGVASREICRRG